MKLSEEELHQIKDFWGVQPYADGELWSDDTTCAEDFWRQAALLDKYLREREKENSKKEP